MHLVNLSLKEIDRIIEKLRLGQFSSADLRLIQYLESVKKDLLALEAESIAEIRYSALVDDNWYFRNRSRDAIVDMFRVVRHLQQLNNLSSSQIASIMATVWTESNDSLHYYLRYLARELRRGRHR